MVYAIKKFRQYLLANKFIFFVDHHALLDLVNKPCSTGQIARWFIILLEFLGNPGRSHKKADHLLRLTHEEAPIGVEDNLLDAVVFLIETAPW